MTPDFSQSEWYVKEVLWEAAPQAAAEVTKWADNTVRTLLMRLVKKGALATGESDEGVRTFRPAVAREACVKAEGASVLRLIFGGAARPLRGRAGEI